MPEIHLRQPGFTSNAGRPFTKNKERIQRFKETGNSWYFFQNKLDKACFQYDMTYGDFNDLTRRKNPKYGGCQRGIASKVCIFCDKKYLVEQSIMKLCRKI